MFIRQFINEKLILRNPVVAETIDLHNRRYGRIDSSIKRFGFVLKIYFAIVFQKKHPAKMWLEKQVRLPYPESIEQEDGVEKPRDMLPDCTMASLAEMVSEIIGLSGLSFKYICELYGDRGWLKELMDDFSVFSKKADNLGNKYRPFYKSSVVLDIYSGIVNRRMHSGIRYSLFYEYGFSAGGLLTYGFCQYLERLAKSNSIDKFVFVARDGDIIKKVYDEFFGSIESSYLIFSRFASVELMFDDYPFEYIEENIHPRINRKSNNTVGSVLRECGLSILSNLLQIYELDENEFFSDFQYEKLKKMILANKQVVKRCFEDSDIAAKEYFMSVVGDAKRVCVVDLGWRGKSIIYLKALLKRYGYSGEVMGALIGAADDMVTQEFVRVGLINPYSFENDYYRQDVLSCGASMNFKQVICFEALFSSASSSLLRYGIKKKNDVYMIYDAENPNKSVIEDVHSGVLDFVKIFDGFSKKYHLKVTGTDAYIPVSSVLNNEKLLNLLLNQYKEKEKAMNGFSE